MLITNNSTKRLIILLYIVILSIDSVLADNVQATTDLFGYKVQPPTHNLTETAIGTIQTSTSVSSMGNSVCSMSIEAPKGPAGLRPQINLTYNSLQKIGVAGYGFDISGISIITRGAKDIYHDGQAKGISFSDEDAFFLDGKRLIQSGESSKGKIFNPEGDLNTIVYMSHDPQMPSVSVFTVEDANGNTITYGSSTAARNDYTSTSGKYCNTAWYVDRCVDRCGNVTIFGYIKDHMHVYPSKIEYGSNVKDDVSSKNIIEFSYESLPISESVAYRLGGRQAYIGLVLKGITTMCGNEVFRKYICEYDKTFPTGFYKRLSKVTVTNGKGESLPSTSMTWNPVGSNYSTSNIDIKLLEDNRDLKMTNRLYLSLDINSDGYDDIVELADAEEKGHAEGGTHYYTYVNYYENTAKYDNQNPQFVYQKTLKLSPNFVSQLSAAWDMPTCIDFDGDGLNDFVMCDKRNAYGSHDVVWQIIPGTNIANNSWDRTLISVATKCKGERNIYSYGNYGNNNRTDILQMEQDPVSGSYPCHLIRYAGSYAQGERVVTNFSLPLNSEPRRLFVSDFNGDGVEDLMVICKNEYTIFWNKEDSIPFSKDSRMVGYGIKDVTNIQMGDFNGDGVADILMNQDKESIYKIAFGNGDGTFDVKEACSPSLSAENPDKDNIKYTMVTTDLDHDGRSDVIIAKASNTNTKRNDIAWLYSNGNSLIQKRHVCITGEDDAKWFYTMLGHFTGSGVLDLIHFGGNILDGNTTYGKRLYYDSSWNGGNGLLASVTDGMGIKTSFSYSMLSNPEVYTCSKASAWPVVNVTTPFTIVNRMAKNNGILNDIELTYKYANLQIERTGRGLLPFEKTEVSDVNNGTTTTTEIKKWDKELFLPLSTLSTTIGSDWETTIQTDNIITKKDNKNHILLSSKSWETDPDGLVTYTENFYDQEYGYLVSSGKYVDNNRMYNVTFYDGYNKRKGTWLPTFIKTTTKHNDDRNEYSTTTIIDYYENGLAKNTTTLADTDMSTTKSTTYDQWGNVTSVSISTSKANKTTTYYNYDSTGRFLIGTRTEPESTSTTYIYDAFGNLLTLTTNANSSHALTTSYIYDSWGRLFQTISPRGALSTTKTYKLSNKEYVIASLGKGCPWRVVWYDQTGRKLKEQTIGDGDVVETKTYVYNQKGYVTNSKAENGKLNLWQAMEYDSRNRVSRTTDSRGTEQIITYGKRSVTTIRDGKKYSTTYDPWGNVKTAKDPLCTVANYYYSNGKPSRSGVYPLYTTMEYDIAGNRTKIGDPDSGTTTYEYNGLGQLLSQTDARGIITENVYNEQNKLVETKVDGISTKFTYGKSGNSLNLPVREEVKDMVAEREYNEYGEVIRETRNIKGRKLSFEYSYDSLGRVCKQTFPNGLRLRYVYDCYGNHVQTYKDSSCVWKLLSFDGKTRKEQIGKDFVRTTVLDSCGYLLSISLKKGATPLHEMHFQYDPKSGNLLSRQGMEQYGTTEEFTYDELDRLTSYTEQEHFIREIEYDKYGRIRYKYGVGDYEIGHGHQVTLVTNELDSITSYPQKVSYNGFGKAAQISGVNGTLNIEYGPDMERWYEKDDRPNRTTYFFGDYECMEMSDDYLDVCYLDGGVLYISSRNNADVYCPFLDNLGSYVKIYSSSGDEVFHTTYDVWGKPTCLKNDLGFLRGYCGHEMIDGGWLINMNGRIYDPWLAVFLSPDCYIQNPLSSQNFNRYSYCINNPLKYTDPSGNVFEFFVASALFNIASNMIIASMNGQNIWKAAARSALTSFATYGIGQLYGPVGSGSIAHEALRAGTHGVVGGIASMLGGGSFGSGFLSSSLSSGVGSFVKFDILGKYTLSAAIGGISAWASGGDILFGALQGLAIGFLNHGIHDDDIAKEIDLPEVQCTGNAMLYEYTRAIGIFATTENALTILKGFNDYMRKVRIGTNGKMYFPKKKGQFIGNQYVKTKVLKGIPRLGMLKNIYQGAEDISEINAALIKDNGQWGENCERCVAKLSGNYIGTVVGAYTGKLAGLYLGQGVFSVPLKISMGIVGGYIGGYAGENIGIWVYDTWY